MQRLTDVHRRVLVAHSDFEYGFEFSLSSRIGRCAFDHDFNGSDGTAFVITNLGECRTGKQQAEGNRQKAENNSLFAFCPAYCFRPFASAF
jgi:hypothetical protein